MFEKKVVQVEDRWSVYYGGTGEMPARALELLAEGLSCYINEYTPEFVRAGQKSVVGNSILIGVGNDNPLIVQLLGEQKIPEQGYRLCVKDSPWQPGKQVAVIVGGDASGLLYGCVDFIYQYLAKADYDLTQQSGLDFLRILDATCGNERVMHLPEIDETDAPKLSKRGLWTWGHPIYNYRGYLDNMLKLKMNQAIIWNDEPPVNGQAFVEYAHRNCVEVIWGFSWAWGVDIDISADGAMEHWKDVVISEYRDHYADMGGDGVYFQTFTETTEDMKDGLVIAEEAVKWVNYISDALLKLYPHLKIQFGLHATSVCHRMDVIAKTDPRVDIIWEDCGAFPYAYSAGKIDGYEETQAFTDEIIHHRTSGEYGAVLKGMMNLDWTKFEYKTGPFMLGCADKGFRDGRTATQRRFWHFRQSDWLVNGDYCRRIVKQLADGCNGQASVTFLVEDGMFEEALWYVVVLGGEMLWNSERSIREIMTVAARRTDVVFA
ncbi:hypothetical protein [Beduinella massiliensis]|uniref:hypothetical protein n=1 Tax=Beduinella massiliensis TaxID=1852363 RepID=UPI000C81A4B4